MTSAGRFRFALLMGALVGLVSCEDGTGTSSATGPSGTPTPPSGATIVIGTDGAVSPAEVVISTGQVVTFVNNHTQPHQIASDPHPADTACPPLNELGTLAAGQTKRTGAFTVLGRCGFHDHNEPENTALQGTIRVQ